jgi:hypothetical protein
MGVRAATLVLLVLLTGTVALAVHDQTGEGGASYGQTVTSDDALPSGEADPLADSDDDDSDVDSRGAGVTCVIDTSVALTCSMLRAFFRLDLPPKTPVFRS